MPPGCTKPFIPSVLRLGKVDGSKWLYQDLETPDKCKSIWHAMVLAMQRHMPGKFKSTDELRYTLRCHVKHRMTRRDFDRIFRDHGGPRSDKGCYVHYLSQPIVHENDPLHFPTTGDIQVLVHYLMLETSFPGCVYIFNPDMTVDHVESDNTERVLELDIEITDVVLVHLYDDCWVAAETRRGIRPLW